MESTEEFKQSEFEKRAKLIKDQYLELYDIPSYVSVYYSTLQPFLTFMLENYYKAFRHEPLLINRNRSDRSLLDFGCGAIPVHVGTAAAAFYTDSITMAEMTPSCRKSIESWINSEKDAPNFDVCFDYMRTLQEKDNLTEEERKDNRSIEQRVKDAFQRVIPCDATLKNPLSPVCQTYDVVISTCCFEATASNHADFKINVGNVLNLVQPGGVIMFTNCIENRFYSFGPGNTYPAANLNKEVIADAVTSQGFTIKDLRLLHQPEENIKYNEDCEDGFNCVYVLAQKSS